MSWKITYKNVYGDVETEEFDTFEEAEARYDELSQRCFLYWDTMRAGEDIPDTCDIDWVDEPEEVNEDGSSACALGAVPTGTVKPERNTMKMKENEEFWIDVASPEYRGAPAPKFNPKAINEPRIPDGMRYKEYTWSEDEFTDGGVILDWVTQETYTPEDREAFKAEVERALKANGFKGKAQVNLNVCGEDDIETFVIDMGKNEAMNPYGHEILTKETIIKHLEDLRDAFWAVRGDMLDYSDEQLATDYEEKVYNAGDKEADRLYGESWASYSFDELSVPDWCDRVIELVKERL